MSCNRIGTQGVSVGNLPEGRHIINLSTTQRLTKLVCLTCGWSWRSRARVPDITVALNKHRALLKDQSHG